MKLIYTILFLVSFQANATIYYVDNAGSDAANGTSEGTAWQTIAKINASTFLPGDQIFLKKGCTWNEQLIPPRSNLYFGSYGTGANPIITGFKSLSSWVNEGSNIWSTTFSNSVNYQNTVYINGALRAKGRYPNTGWLIFNSSATKNTIAGSLTTNYTGSEIVIRTNNYIIDKAFITSQVDSTIHFSPSTYYNLTNGNGYFIQNSIQVLDLQNEWSYDSAAKKIYVYSTTEPTGKASSIDTMVNLTRKDSITFDGLSFEGANTTVFLVDTSNNITIKNCLLNEGLNGIQGKISNNILIESNIINKFWNDGIVLFDFNTALANCHDPQILNNTISNTGTVAGMGKTSFHTYTGIMVFGNRPVVKYNRITNTGYIGCYFYGDSSIVKYNYVDTFCYIKDDGGGLYTFTGSGQSYSGHRITSNIVKNGFSATAGTGGFLATAGIYMDNKTVNAIIDSNTVSNITLYGILLNDSRYIEVLDNNFINTGTSLALSITPIENVGLKFIRNKSYINTLLYKSSASFGNKNLWEKIDSNYYANPADTNHIASTNIHYSLSAWQSFSGFDLHSGRIPTGITTAEPILKYNATISTVVIPLDGTYRDFAGTDCINSVTLAPFQSEILFKATVDLTPPPTYIQPYNRVRKMKFKKIL